MNIEPNKVYDLRYRCEVYKDVDEGEVRAFWNGETDTWGKLTILPIDGDAPRYLFEREIVDAEPCEFVVAKVSTHNLITSREELAELAPALVDMLREFVCFGTCQQANAYERKSLAEKFAELAHEALEQFPQLKLNHVGAKTIIRDVTS